MNTSALLAAASLLLVAAVGPRPPVVAKVFPPEGSTSSQVPAVGAELDFTRADGADPASLRLLVDDVDVTSRATLTTTRDWPPSFVSISYAPIGLRPGSHRVEVRFRTDGGTVRYAWTFTVRPP